MLPKDRLRDLQAADTLGATYRVDENRVGRFRLGDQEVPFQRYEWLWVAGYLELDGDRLVPTEKAEKLLSNPQEREWLYSVAGVRPARNLRDFPEKARVAARDYDRKVGIPKTGPEDDELFLEEVARFTAVADQVDNDRIWLNRDGAITNLATGEPFTGDRDALFPWGAQPRLDETCHPVAADRFADRYYHWPVFTRYAGRKVRVVDADEGQLLAACEQVAGEDGRVVVKVTRPKYGMTTINVRHSVAHAIVEDDLIMGALMHLDGTKDAFLVQKHIEMQFERRFFIVDGLAVASAGCIPAYTPFDRLAPHDPRMRRHRRDGEDIIWAPEQTKTLHDFADRIATELRHSGNLSEYVLDVALNRDGNPLIVEFNGIRNAGLYASDPHWVVRALLRRDDVWGRAPHARPRATVSA